MPEATMKQPVMAATKTNTTNGAVQKAKKQTFAAVVKSDAVQHSIQSTLGDVARSKKFTANIISSVSMNPQLAQCEPMSVISAALVGEALNLSPSPMLGQMYIVPFKNTKEGVTKGQFQLGWKGYYQLAMRSGQYKYLDAVAIKEGELVSFDPITGKAEFNPIMDPLKRESAKTIGYYGYFQLVNGFEKKIYWSKEKMEAHALKYSKGYVAKKGFTFWEKDFDEMGLKTIYRQLISKFGVMSIELQQAFEADDHINNIDAETGEVVQEYNDDDIQINPVFAQDAEYTESVEK